MQLGFKMQLQCILCNCQLLGYLARDLSQTMELKFKLYIKRTSERSRSYISDVTASFAASNTASSRTTKFTSCIGFLRHPVRHLATAAAVAAAVAGGGKYSVMPLCYGCAIDCLAELLQQSYSAQLVQQSYSAEQVVLHLLFIPRGNPEGRQHHAGFFPP